MPTLTPYRSVARRPLVYLGLIATLGVSFVVAPAFGAGSPPPPAAAATASAVQDGYGVANDGAVSVVDLAGSWGFTPVQPAAAATTIQVPGGGWVKQGFTTTTEAVYSRSITIPSTAAGQTVILSLGAVNHQATLKVGNQVVGTTTTSYTPTSFDLTPFVSPGQSYAITLDVKGRGALKSNGKYIVPQAADWAESVPQGIYRSASLRFYPGTYVASTFVRTSVQNRSVSYDVTVRNSTATAQNITLAGSFSSASGASFSYPSVGNRTVTVPARSSTTTTIGPLSWTAGTTSYWWPNVPYVAGYRAQLHVLSVQLTGNGVSQTQRTRFGFREFTQPDNQSHYFLNGSAINLRGDDLQGADFDRVDNNGKGDAFDTLAGFLPPSSGNAGWPKAVDNYQRLNYNVVRLHQEIPSPYMIDVLDEMGMMAIGESAIRGSGQAEDYVVGHDNMVNHVRALVERDRNHPAIVEWSQSNEADWAPSNSEQFEKDLFNAIRAADPTRPIIAELNIAHGLPEDPYPSMNSANGYSQFNQVGHYLDGFANYGTAVRSINTRPKGEGEFIWPAGSTKQGMTWFATSTVGKRGKGAADLRPYTLLSAWAGFVPGTKTTDFVTEENRAPIYGEDNLSSPWTNAQIQLIQTGFSPYLVADLPYWDANGASDAGGSYPLASTVQPIPYGSSVQRTVSVFNDGLTGTSLQFSWEARLDSPTGAVIASGGSNLTVPLAEHVSTPVSFVAPTAGNAVYIVLKTAVGGSTVFSDARESFPLGAQSTVDDAVIGTGDRQFSYSGTWGHSSGESGLYSGTNSYSNVTGDTATIPFSGNSATYYAVKAPNHGVVGVSVDGGAERTVDLYAPTRSGDQSVFTTGTLASGAHTLRIRVTGTKNSSSTGFYGTVDRVDAPTSKTGAITGVQSGRCLDLYNHNAADGAVVDIYDCDGGANQRWTLDARGQLVNSESGKCLDVTGGATADGTAVQQFACNGQVNQKWSYDGARRFVSAASGKCLDVYQNATANQSRVVIWTCSTGSNQQWSW